MAASTEAIGTEIMEVTSMASHPSNPADAMALDLSGPLAPDCQWPYKPRWELDGFDFSLIPVALHRQAVATLLYRTSFTTITGQTRNKTAEAFSIRACNNTVVLFQALLFCRDYYPDPIFWRRVNQCMGWPGFRFIENVEDMLVKARKAFRQYDTDPPNEAAKLADDWIAWRDSSSPGTETTANTSFQTSWSTRKSQWFSMMSRGGLKDQGYAPIQPAAVETAFTPPVIKDEPGLDDICLVTYDGPADDEISRPSRKRQRSTTPSLRSAKRPATGANAVPVPTSGDQDEEEEDPVYKALREWEASRTVEARLAVCEEKLAEQHKEISDHDTRLMHQECDASNLATKVVILDSQFITYQGTELQTQFGYEREQRRHEQELLTLRRAVEDLTERLASWTSHVRTEATTQIAEARASLEQEQDHLNTRLESFRDDLAVHKVRVGDCQKAVEEHVTERKNHETAVNLADESLKKKIRLERTRINELFDRLTEVEKKLGDDNGATAVKNEDTDDDVLTQMEARLTSITERITALEKDRASPKDKRFDGLQSAIAKIHNRLGGLETSHAALKKLADKNSSSVGHKIATLGDRLKHQERLMASANASIASHHARLAQANIGPARNSAPR